MEIHMYGRCTSQGHEISYERREIFLLVKCVAPPAIMSLVILRDWLLMSKSQVITITLKAQVSLSN